VDLGGEMPKLVRTQSQADPPAYDVADRERECSLPSRRARPGYEDAVRLRADHPRRDRMAERPQPVTERGRKLEIDLLMVLGFVRRRRRAALGSPPLGAGAGGGGGRARRGSPCAGAKGGGGRRQVRSGTGEPQARNLPAAGAPPATGGRAGR